MLKRSFHIILALFLVFTTTGSIWGQLLEDKDDPIEVSSSNESDTEKTEKESKKGFDDWGDDLATGGGNIIPEIYCGLLKVGSSSYAPALRSPKKLYLVFSQLKLDC